MKPAALTEEEWAIQQLLEESEHACAECGEGIQSVEELKLIEVVYINREADLAFYAIENDEGEYQYPPSFFHIDCWENVLERLWEYFDSVEPVPDSYGICACNGCASDIRAWETVAVVRFGEFRRPPVQPDGAAAFVFAECDSRPEVYCIGCLRELNAFSLEMWDDVSHNGECESGSHERCWRTGTCMHGCQHDRRAAE